MSLCIQPNKITSILVAGEWIDIDPGSFYLDAYEYVDFGDDELSDGDVWHGGGDSGVCATGFRVTPRGFSTQRIQGPLTAIQAVRTIAA